MRNAEGPLSRRRLWNGVAGVAVETALVLGVVLSALVVVAVLKAVY
jgi:hypothetical protein